MAFLFERQHFQDEVRGVFMKVCCRSNMRQHAPQQIALPPDVQSVLYDLVTHHTAEKQSELNRDFAYFTIAKQATLFCCTENR
jgi:hypothetical protein